jgi:hypothetical protein
MSADWKNKLNEIKDNAATKTNDAVENAKGAFTKVKGTDKVDKTLEKLNDSKEKLIESIEKNYELLKKDYLVNFKVDKEGLKREVKSVRNTKDTIKWRSKGH